MFDMHRNTKHLDMMIRRTVWCWCCESPRGCRIYFRVWVGGVWQQHYEDVLTGLVTFSVNHTRNNWWEGGITMWVHEFERPWSDCVPRSDRVFCAPQTRSHGDAVMYDDIPRPPGQDPLSLGRHQIRIAFCYRFFSVNCHLINLQWPSCWNNKSL